MRHRPSGPIRRRSRREDLCSARGKWRLTRRPAIIGGDVAPQTERVLKNLAAVLDAAGSGLAKVVRTTVFLKNMSDFAAMNEVYGRHFTRAAGRSTVEAARLPKDVLVEIDVIALA